MKFVLCGPFFYLVVLAWLLLVRAHAADRQTVDLDGTWQLADGQMAAPPKNFDRTVPVPGLVDMATPAFAEVGVPSSKRTAFWYRTTFSIPGEVPPVATLRIARAFFGTKAFLNGVDLGEHDPLFTPAYFDLRKALRGGGAQNELLVRVGATPDQVPETVPRGHDFEKKRYIPGIFDTVRIILSGTPNIVRVQTAPRIDTGVVQVQVLLHATGTAATTPVTVRVTEVRSGRAVGSVTVPAVAIAADSDLTVEMNVPIPQEHLWSPEDPFLYALEVTTSGDRTKTHFGMRELHFDPASGHCYLNGKPYFWRGTNISLYRFFEDADRGNLPWDRAWAKRLYDSFRQFHWNGLRYSIGFPPEFWYDLADEEGFLIQDEFPIWTLDAKVPTQELVREYTEFVQDDWNHPSVVLWDAQNESLNDARTGSALMQMRHIDLSNRPWDNGWGGVQTETDPYEAHPYHYFGTQVMSSLAKAPRVPTYTCPSVYRAAILINEYGGIWLQRNGLPTNAIRAFYDNILGPSATPEQYRQTYAHYMAADTEFWRGNLGCAGVMEFTALSYSGPTYVTSDHFIDLANLVYEPHMAEAFKNAFAPVGLMIDYWETDVPASSTLDVPVMVVNDLEPAWQGAVTLTLRQGDHVFYRAKQNAAAGSFGHQRVVFHVPAPAVTATYDLQASIVGADAQTVVSDRAFPVFTVADETVHRGYPASATASSETLTDGKLYPAQNAADDNGDRWSSNFNDAEWIKLDLGSPQIVGRVTLNWEAAFGKVYRIETSRDDQSWTAVAHQDNGHAGLDKITFAPVTARWVRMTGVRRGSVWGYSLWSFRAYPPTSAP